MRLLLDTHYVVWLVDEPKRLRPAERDLILSPENEFSVSAASIWEIRLKWTSRYKSGQSKLETPPEAALRAADFLGFNLLPVSMRHAAAWLEVPLTHRDPFDEILLIQAQEESMRLLTHDRLLRDHPLALFA